MTEEWINSRGEKVLRELGISESQKVVDFGSGEGIYTIIASQIVGASGRIFSIDNDKAILDELKQKLRLKKIQNVKLFLMSNEIELPLADNSVDIFLLFDVYHLLDTHQRKKIIEEAARVLQKSGLLLYHATHLKSYNIKIERVKNRMIKNGLIFKQKVKKLMFHWSWIEEGLILIFSKITKE
ncbi:MAG: methyltransferase domain-containing protein [Candidatus Lokiarchaeota archaeon]|nr:methyltransferase domain-containing protein [Candidatus Lokiarchaeota archaeon]